MERITVYSTTWCGDCRRTKRFLNEHGISFQEIDIDRDPASAQTVIDWSGGRRVIPTIRIDCESKSLPVILHNPPIADLTRALGL
ncbi:MAG: glutaredoxin family protein [Bacteroidota bacterium]